MVKQNLIDLIRVWWRAFFIQSTWNNERMMNLGFCFCLLPRMPKLFNTESEKYKFVKRHMEYFNTHPYMASFIIGAVLKMEESGAGSASVNLDQINKFKQRLSGPLGAVGDQLFWKQIKCVATFIGILCYILFQNAYGVILFLLIYNLPHLVIQTRGLWLGYRLGENLIKKFSFKIFFDYIKGFEKLAIFLIGVLMGSWLIGSDSFRWVEVLAFFLGGVTMFLVLRLKSSVPAGLLWIVTGATIIGFLL